LKEGFESERLKVIYNSVNYEISKPLREKAVDKNFYKEFFNNDLQTLIFIGRLTRVKKLHLLIESLADLNAQGKRFNLLFLGDGEVRKELEKLAFDLKQDVIFYGACYDEVKISKFIANADLCVSPGNVGLTSVHAMSYGTPVCTTDDFKNQGPEFEAIKAWETGCFFDQNKGNLTDTISRWFEIAKGRERIRQSCYDVVDTYYNPQVQLEVLKDVLDNVV
jgi:glycosyltransferase involved in cell wall biosynthesis